MAINRNAFTDASAQPEKRSNRIYKDFNLNFSRHPITGDIATLSDVDAVKRSVRNLVNTNFYERPFHPEIGSNIRASLFEPVSPIIAEMLSKHVEDLINNFEPRVELASVTAFGDIDNNQYNITIEFYLLNSPDGLQEINLFLQRLR